MAAQLNALKGHLKVDKHLKDALNNDKKTRNKKNKGNKNRQKEGEVWKKITLKDGNKKSKQVGKHTYHWCEHHMVWCMHLPSECRLGKQCKEEQTPTGHLRHLCRRRCFNRQPSIPSSHCQHRRFAGAV